MQNKMHLIFIVEVHLYPKASKKSMGDIKSPILLRSI